MHPGGDLQPVRVGHPPVGALGYPGERAGGEEAGRGRDQPHGEPQQPGLEALEDRVFPAVGAHGGPVGAQGVVEADGPLDGALGPPACLLAPALRSCAPSSLMA